MTHYEVLGVDPGAGVDEIRAAYRARARELHPDRRGTGAGQQMAAVNQAWAVLGDPVRRATYDAWLKDASAPGAGPKATTRVAPGATPGSTASDWHHGDSLYDEDHPPPLHSAMPGCFGSGALPWLALVLVLIVIFIFTAYAAPSDNGPSDGPGASDPAPTDEPEVPMTAVRDIRGMCIREAGGIISPVDCFTRPNEGQIVAQASIGGSCPTGTTEWLVRQLDTLACTTAASGAGS